MHDDLLSKMLGALQAKCVVSGRHVAGGTWSALMDKYDAIKLHAVIKGSCWYLTEDLPEAIVVTAGDVVVAAGGPAIAFASDPALLKSAARNCPTPDQDGNYRVGDGDDFQMFCCALVIEEEQQGLLQRGMPPL